MRYNFEFERKKQSYTSGKLSPSLSESHSCSYRLKILIDLGGIFAWLKLEEHMFGWLGEASIDFVVLVPL